ncbi:Squamosa promoter-binding-like protein 7 [Trifolium repens]|nr:Squamosa promoter-binding-like protein 7 [Trifolium repens]
MLPIFPSHLHTVIIRLCAKHVGWISFMPYDWNPAEFPRRLRLRIFQWLANMPGELEGCIRPVCPVLTIFIAVPNIMWINLLKVPMYYVCEL